MKHNLLCLVIICFCSFRISAQELLLTLEAEKAILTLPSKVKTVEGYSGNAYVGDNDPGSGILFTNVNVAKEGTYEFATYYTSMHVRSIAIQSGNYPAIISTMPFATEDWNRPPVGVMYTYIYLNAGDNILKITPYNGGGPNIDKFELRTTSVIMPRPEIEKKAFAYDLTDNAIIQINGKDETNSLLNDNDESTVYEYPGTTAEVYIECDMPYLVTGYLLSAGFDSTQDLKNWKLEYSPDGITYKLLIPSDISESNASAFFQIARHPHGDSGANAAKYYRLTSQGGKIGEVQLFGLPYLTNTDGKNFPIDITDGIDLSAYVTGEPLGEFFDSFDERYFNLFNRDMSKKYYWGRNDVFHVDVEIDTPHYLNYYTLTSCHDYPERDPKSWIVEGFDRDWETVSEVNGFIFPCRYATMRFPVNNTKSYRGFRLRMIENNGADRFQLLKWQLFGNAGSSSVGSVNHHDFIDINIQRNELCIVSRERNVQCRILNLSGQVEHQAILTSEPYTWQLTPGIYIIQATVGSKSIIRKIMIGL